MRGCRTVQLLNNEHLKRCSGSICIFFPYIQCQLRHPDRVCDKNMKTMSAEMEYGLERRLGVSDARQRSHIAWNIRSGRHTPIWA